MVRDPELVQATPLAAVLALLAENPEARDLARMLYSGTGLDDAPEPATLAAAAVASLAFIKDKPNAAAKIRVRAVAGGSVVEILNDDMPFLVDSVMGEIQARGLVAHLAVHPIFKSTRTSTGTLKAMLQSADQNWADGHQESLIAVHLDPLSADVALDLEQALAAILADVRSAVTDWKSMTAVVDRAIKGLAAAPAPITEEQRQLSVAFLEWLKDGHFIALGSAELGFVADGTPTPIAGSALGILRDANLHILRPDGREAVVVREGTGSAPLVISKASALSRVHRRVLMDYIAIKTYGAGHALAPTGEIRLVGLFTSKAYTQTARQIPFLNHKIDAVLALSGYPAGSHASKALASILDTFPRDELFQISTTDLSQWSAGILDLEMRPRVRLFSRADPFGRFISVLLYAPRERWTTTVRENISGLLARVCRGSVTDFHPFFLEGPLLRAHFIVAIPDGQKVVLNTPQLETEITALMRTWDDRLADSLNALGPESAGLSTRYGTAFPAAYAETFDAPRALEDMRRTERLASTGEPVAIDFYSAGQASNQISAAISRFGDAIRLSERVPVLENLGFSVIDERSYRLAPRFADQKRSVALHHMLLETADGSPFDLAVHEERLEDAFRAVLRGSAENDVFNRLIMAAGMDWREAALMRAYAAYLRQLAVPFGIRYLGETLLNHSGVARDMVELFHIRFSPERPFTTLDARTAAAAPVRVRIDGALATVPSLDEDRILRYFLNLIDATVRTNFFQRTASGQASDLIALKFDSKAIEAAPQPRPYREIWVASPRVEAVHLRFAPIARGGIRWSDRAQDFRTEVLGLVKAQLVKNAVIVPSGAKGGFLPKQLPRAGTRDDVMKEGIAAYRLFISALLDITDNIVDGKLVPPAAVVRHDGDDPYLVVAADKGTATFSDFANEISAAHQHWLGDAFASGGSVGYDHKKMAITARGGWECVKRHFREMDWDIQRKAFCVTGVGDMSGDVFGNGMLLSPVIALVAAFDHRDIFIDPTPDTTASFAERKRLFDLPRSSWQDYDKTKLSQGGIVVSRAAKRVDLSPEVRGLLRLEQPQATPHEIMRAILKCQADLIWFGGIGTYVRATVETDDQVGDRSNDAIRVTAAELGARVVGEGANLGLTQKARVELAQRGVRLNTDFIDNSAGVNSSDLEVNIKIALGRMTQSGTLVGDQRSKFLASLTDDVARRCLINNYDQSLAVSLLEQRSSVETRDLIRLIHDLERRKLLDRRLECLPTDTELLARQRAGKPLTRPELAVLLSYSKIALTEDLLASAVPDAPPAAALLTAYMPKRLAETYAADVASHRLRREIIATAITNAALNRAGPAFVWALSTETGRTNAEIATAYLAANAVFSVDALWARIDALDDVVPGQLQLKLHLSAQALLRTTMRDLAVEAHIFTDQGRGLADLGAGVASLRTALRTTLPEAARLTATESRQRLEQQRVPADLAADLSVLTLLADAPAIARLAHETGRPIELSARLYLELGADLRVAELKAKAASLDTADAFDALAIGQALQQLSHAQAKFTRAGLAAAASSNDLDTWRVAHAARMAPSKIMLDQIAGDGALTVSRLVVVANRLQDAAT